MGYTYKTLKALCGPWDLKPFTMDVYIIQWASQDVNISKTDIPAFRFEIHGFGKTVDGTSVVCRILFDPYLYLKLTDTYPKQRLFVEECRMKYGTQPESGIVMKKDAWGYREHAESFAKLVFPNMMTLRRAKKELSHPIYEGNVDPIVRLCHDTGISPVGWVTVHGSESPKHMYPRAQKEVIVRSACIKASPRTSIPPLVMCSWDIEVYSHDGSFPSPAHPENKVIQIASAFQRLGDDEPYECSVVCLGDTSDVDGTTIISVQDEVDVILEWIELLNRNHVDILLAYNSWQFDWEYLIGRNSVFVDIDECRDVSRALTGMGRGGPGAGEIKTWELNSGAYGQNSYSVIKAPGVVDVDLMQLIKRDHKLESYSLNNVSLKFLNDSKVDLPAYQIFEKFVQGPDERAEIARYAAQDVLLPLRLFRRLNLFDNLTQMSIATCVPVEYLLTRGQQIKVYSLILKQAKDMGFVLPDNKKMGIEGKFEGATVLDAKKGVYYDPVCGLDFASLYPSIIRSYNLCYSTLVMPGTEMPANVYTIDTGIGTYSFCQDSPGIVPKLLENLATWRKDAKKKMAACKKQGDTFGESLWNGAQLAFKISMNSVYGFTGASKGFLPCVPIAASTTATGRRLIDETKQMCLDMVPGSDVVYGDSVAEYTPIYCRIDGNVYITTFEDVAKRLTWKNARGKQYAMVLGFETWSDAGWTKVKRFIRHRHTGPLIRVTTPCGVVDVTEDHSLVDSQGNMIKPASVRVGDSLLHTPLPKISPAPSTLFDGMRVEKTSQLDAAVVVAMFSDMGLYSTIEVTNGIYSITGSSRATVDTRVTSKESIEYTGTYVYDISTANQHFSAGPGTLVVHNTDSVMVRFKVPPEHAVDMSYHFKLAEEVASKITAKFPGCVELEFEKVYFPYMLFSKKRYAGLMYTSPDAPDYIDVKGIQIVRRDNAPIVKMVSQSILDAIMYDKSTDKALEKARDWILHVLRGSEPIESFIVSKTLRGSYANPNAQPHVVVARKIQERTGKIIQSGVRVPYVFVVDDALDELISQRAEDPEYVKEHGVPLDTIFYIDNQLTSPINALLELLVDNPMMKITSHPNIQPILSNMRHDRQTRLTTTKRLKKNAKNKQLEITKFFKH